MGALDAIFSFRLFSNGTELLTRKKVNLIGVTAVDNVAEERTDITIVSSADLTAALALKANKKLTFVTVSDTSKSLSASDEETVQECTSDDPVSITAEQLAAGSVVVLAQIGEGQITVVAGSGVTLEYGPSYQPKSLEQFTDVILRWRTTTIVQVTGQLASAA